MAIQPIMLKLSRTLRRDQTPWEKVLWKHLRAGRFKGLKFKRQVVIGKYVVDFCCSEKMLVIELDGGQHDDQPVRQHDLVKENFLKSKGYTVLRFWNNEIKDNLPGVLEKIYSSLGSTSLPTSPLARGEG